MYLQYCVWTQNSSLLVSSRINLNWFSLRFITVSYIHTCARIHTYVQHMYACMHTCMHKHMHAYKYWHTHIYICTYVHIHAYNQDTCCIEKMVAVCVLAAPCMYVRIHTNTHSHVLNISRLISMTKLLLFSEFSRPLLDDNWILHGSQLYQIDCSFWPWQLI